MLINASQWNTKGETYQEGMPMLVINETMLNRSRTAAQAKPRRLGSLFYVFVLTLIFGEREKEEKSNFSAGWILVSALLVYRIEWRETQEFLLLEGMNYGASCIETGYRPKEKYTIKCYFVG